MALLDDGRLIAEKAFGEGSRHGRDLLPCVNEVLGGDPKSLGLVAVSAGPGSYTGLRVGIAFAKTFGVETGVPVATVSSLDAVAANVPGPWPLCVVVDARLGQVYAAVYDEARTKIVGDVVASPGEIASKLRPETRVVGDGLRRYREILAAAANVIDDESLWWPSAANVGRLGLARFKQAGGEDPHNLAPRYLRRPQAEVKWEKSRNGPGPK